MVKEYTISCGRGKCCPKLQKQGKYWLLIDDYGGMVRLTIAQLRKISEMVEVIK